MDSLAFEKRRETVEVEQARQSLQEEINAKGAGYSGPSGEQVGPRSAVEKPVKQAVDTAGQWGSDFLTGLDNLGAPERWAVAKALSMGNPSMRKRMEDIPFEKAALMNTQKFMEVFGWPEPGSLNSTGANALAGVGGLALGMVTDPLNWVPGGGQAKAAASAGKQLTKGKGTVRPSAVQPPTPITSEQELRKLVDPATGTGPSWAILTDNDPKQPMVKDATPTPLDVIIKRLGPSYQVYPVKGMFGGPPEKSFMVVSSTPNDQELYDKLLDLRKVYGQHSIATDKGLMAFDGTILPRVGAGKYGQEAVATKLYSEVETPGGVFTFHTPINWDAPVPQPAPRLLGGMGFATQRFAATSTKDKYFLGGLPKGVTLKSQKRYQGEFNVNSQHVYDYELNPYDLPEEGAEQWLLQNGYTATRQLTQDGVPTLRTLKPVMYGRVIDRGGKFDGPEENRGNPKSLTVFPPDNPGRLEDGLKDGKIDDQTRKDLVQVGAAMLALPELTSARKASAVKGVAAGAERALEVRTGETLKANAVERMTDEDLQDYLTYMTAPDQSKDENVRKGWLDLIRQIETQWDEISKTIKVEHVDGDPYKTSKEMVDDFRKTGVLKISKDHNEHPIFTPEQNLKFRAVHDYKGHIEPGNDFGMAGERGTYQAHLDSIEGEAAKEALRVEIIGQASSMLANGGKFQPQKIYDRAAQAKKLGLVEGASVDLFGTWRQAFEEQLPDTMKGKLSLEQHRDLFNDSVKAFSEHLKKVGGNLPNTETLLGLMNNSDGRAITEWYDTAWPELERLFGEDADKVVKLIALFSPQNNVKDNVEEAVAAYRAWKLGEQDPAALMRAAGYENDFPAVSHNLQRMMRSNWEEELSGRKVVNFLAAMKGDQNAVVIDGHMAGIWGFADASDDKVYTFIEGQIRLLAQELNVMPAQAQAIMWGAWKSTKGQGAELKNLNEFLKDYGRLNKDLLAPGHGLDEAGIAHLQMAWLIAKTLGGGVIGGTIGEDPTERLQNALIGAGLGFLASKPVIQKIGQKIRENMPAKFFKPAGSRPAPVQAVMTPEEIMKEASVEAAQQARLDALRNQPKTVTVGNIQYELDMKALDSPAQIKQAVDEMARVYKAQLDNGTLAPGSRGVIPNVLARRLGQHLGLTEADVLARTRGSVEAVEHVFAYADIMDAAKQRAMMSYELFASGHKAVEADFVKDIDRYVQVGYQLTGLLEELGRGLQAGGDLAVKGLTQGFKGFSGPFEILQRHGSLNGDSLAALVKETGIEKAAEIGKAVERAGLWDMVAEVTYGFTLSNPRSTFVNVASSSLLNPILTVLTRNMAETIGSGAVVDGEARAMLFGYFSGVKRMMRAVGDTYRKEGGVLNLMRSIRNVRPVGESAQFNATADSMTQVMGQADKSGVGRKAITGENVSALLPKPFQFDPSGWLGRIVDAAGATIRIPSQLMELGDHFGYAVNYDMAMHARAFREGVKQGKTGDALEAFIEQELKTPSPEIRREAETFAQHEIFKQLIDGYPGKIVEGLGHPALRPFITFVRTPVNIFRYNLEGVPVLNLALKGVRDDIAAGGARRDLALAKMTLGGTVAALAGMYASQDKITGNGPDNAKARALWLIDHKPYSVKLPYTNQWVGYKYFDPVAAWFGMAADANHFMAFDKDDLTTGEAAMSIVLGLARNFTDKTYARDTFEFLDQLTVKPGDNAETALNAFERYMDKKATTYVPFSSLSRAVRNAVDPHVREAFTLMEKVKNTIPGWSASLPEKLDFFGDPIVNPRFHSFAPFPMKEDTGDEVVEELIRLRANVGMPSKVYDGEELTAQEYRDLVYARGKEAKGGSGKVLRDALIEVFNSEMYRDPATTDAARALTVENLVQGYTQEAYMIMAQKGGGTNMRWIKHQQAVKRAEELTGQKLNLNFGTE